VASLPEVLGDAAVLVDPYSVDELAAGMARVLADPELRAELRGKGLERAARFTWERTARETLGVLRSAIH
jgi:glycosyltransferase involved in cell wall biosynthesis